MARTSDALDPTAALDAAALDAVVFDIGGVFTVRHHEEVCAGMRRRGFELPAGPQPYHRAHYAAVRAASQLYLGHDPADRSDDEPWAYLERGYLRSLGVAEGRLEAAVAALLDLVTSTPVLRMWRQLVDENVEGFGRIVTAGVPVAVVSNNNGTAEEQLRTLGVCQVGPGPLPAVATVVDSTLVGVRKPDPAIFAPALDVLGTEPGRTLYVGDTVHADVLGAVAAGMPVVQLDPYDLHADFGHARLPDVAALAALLVAG